MKPIAKQNWITWTALLLALPTAYFITISVLKYEMGVDGPMDAIRPWLERMGIKETLGWNINLLILLGPIAACVLLFFQLVKIQWELSREDFRFHFTIRRSWFPILVAAFSVSSLAILTLYLFGENCTC